MTNEEFKKTLWDAANKLRGSVSAAEYKYPVLGLVFLKYVSDLYEAQADVIRGRLADPKSDIYIENAETRAGAETAFVTDKTFYESDNVFWVPETARFNALLKKASDPTLPQKLDAAMREIEVENPSLNGVLYREFSRLALEPGKLGELMAQIGRLMFDPKTHGSRDVFGEVYEYFLGGFAMAEGQRAGEFYTPKSVVNLIVEILAPFKGKLYDPACGSGGMFVQSQKFKDAHQGKGKKGDLAVYGQELMAQTRRLCMMNMAVHGLDGDIGQTYGSTFTNDQHKSLRADYVMANPPFNISDWDGDKLTDDPRWVYGIPPAGNANYAWLQHMLARLSGRGRAGIVLSNGSMSSQQSGEGEIRKNMVVGDVVECMVAMPGQLFSNTQIPACLWFLSKDKKAGINGSVDRRGVVLFLDLRKAASGRISRTQIEFTEEDLRRFAMTYHRWRGTEFSDGEAYADESGFCRSVGLEEIKEHGYVLTPGRFVGSEDIEDNDESHSERMRRLVAQLSAQMQKRLTLDASIKTRLEVLGYEL
ncbi:MAG: class I SAM-dependent DNA methyltransferase [Polaromonas sp.]|uniref:type I restriction-modification system subunit M n=1 Tax=Polaromonas sp. TaxID=1869339 RepID=UPI0027352897|nr:class I SAM-dependent DNA methyltransferase [Polaromonas sp.]MDP3247959.1 class I SAM-dependent DNA methyltransferase [Polaromonas sp.]